MRFLVVFLPFLMAACGYFDSIVSPVETTPATFAGTVLDSLTGLGLPEAMVILSGESDAFAVTDAEGRFRFSSSTTGRKRLRVTRAGYGDFEGTAELAEAGNDFGTILLARRNAPPTILRVLYPTHNARNAPLTLGFRWLAGDADFFAATSRERLGYRFYFGPSDSLWSSETALLDLPAGTADTLTGGVAYHLLHKPDSIFTGLTAGRSYRWKLVLVDEMGDSTVAGPDSFTTRSAFTQACPAGMLLVEMETLSFCMDRYEFTNEDYIGLNPYYTYDSSYGFSMIPDGPVVNVEFDSADNTCRKAGKRLCTVSEWQAASGGYKRLAYPYGNAYDSSRCRTHVDPNELMESAVVAAGSLDSCVSSYGIYDLSGNAAEWVVKPFIVERDTNGAPYRHFAGGYWGSKAMSGTASLYRTTLDKRKDIGFRCCKDIR